MPAWTRTFVCTLFATCVPSLASAGSLLYARADADVDPATGLIIAHLESQQGVNWTDYSEGGKYAEFDPDLWSSARSAVQTIQKRDRLATTGTSINHAARALATLQKRDDGQYIEGGVDTGDGKHAAFFSCYNSGQASWSNVVSLLTGVGCGALTNGAQHVGTRVWVSKEFWTPNRKVAKVFMTIIGDGLNLAAAAECSWAASYAATKICQKDNNQQTQGGKMHIYTNGPEDWTNGKEIATLKIDPNTCSKDIPCGTPE